MLLPKDILTHARLLSPKEIEAAIKKILAPPPEQPRSPNLIGIGSGILNIPISSTDYTTFTAVPSTSSWTLRTL